jgi:transposase-like protein
MLLFPIQSLMNNGQCHAYLRDVLHPAGFGCPRCGLLLSDHRTAHKYSKQGTPSYRCKQCGRVFTIFTQTIFQGVTYSCVTLVLILRGLLKGETTAQMSQELGINYKNLLDWRHLLQEFCFENRDLSVLTDGVVESDEVFINAGQKGDKHPLDTDPPRVRANKKKA